MSRPKVLPMGNGHKASQIESSPKMPRTNVLSAGKGHVASQNESGPPTMMELFTIITKKFEEVNMKFEELHSKLDDMVKEIRNTNQRCAGLQQLQAQQPRLAVKADVLEDKKTRKSRGDFAPDGRLEDISSGRVYDSMRLTSFDDQEYIEPPALPCRDNALINQGHEVPKPCLSPVEMRKSTPAGGLLHAGSASTNKAQGTNFPPQFLPWSFRETNEEKNTGTTRQAFAKYNRSWPPKVTETKSRQNMFFDPSGLSGCLCVCPLWKSDARCIVGGLIREAFATGYSHLCFFSFS